MINREQYIQNRGQVRVVNGHRQKTVKVQAIKSRVNKVGTRQQGIVNYLNNQKSDTGNQQWNKRSVILAVAKQDFTLSSMCSVLK